MKSINRKVGMRFGLMMAGIVGMGVFLSFLIEVNLGTDTSSFMNLALSERFGISFGTCMVLANILFFIPEILLEPKLINIGTIMNMVLIGYISDTCRVLWSRYLPRIMFTVQPYQTFTFLMALLPFLVSVALYMNADMGQAPYDAIPTIISRHSHLPYHVIRMIWDFSAILIGVLAGKHLSVATVVMALTIGPSVAFIGKFKKFLFWK
ncbi:hypothetical protein AALB39_10870 [Lachnospiraceae bacterium 54-53]